jgi:arginine decarboxylase
VENGQQVVSANFVTPYPPGYPVLVPGQVFSAEILSFMRSLDTPEVHGYRPDLGYRVYIDKALEIAAAATAMEIAVAGEQLPVPQAGPARRVSKGIESRPESRSSRVWPCRGRPTGRGLNPRRPRHCGTIWRNWRRPSPRHDRPVRLSRSCPGSRSPRPRSRL